MTDNAILQEQIAYYCARANEYDDWFYRLRNYDHGALLNAKWFQEADEVRQSLHQLGPVEHILELACGTGIWTAELVRIGKQITAIDVSAEMIAINRLKLPSANVTYRQEDLFVWEPKRNYDLVLSAFWLSHIPPEQLQPFLQKVSRAVKPGGKFFMVDSRRQELTGAKGRTMHTIDEIYHIRQLNDGQRFKIVKIYYDPDELEKHFARAGFKVTASFTENFFIFARGQRIG